MTTVYFTSRRSPPRRHGSTSTRGDQSRTRSIRNTLRRSLQKPPHTTQCQWCHFHHLILIHLQQIQLTRWRWSSIWWHNRCTKMQYLWSSSSVNNSWRSIKRSLPNPQYPESPLYEMRWDDNHQDATPGASGKLQGQSLLHRYLWLVTDDTNNQTTERCH